MTLNAPLSQLRSTVIKCPRFTDKVLPNIVREKIKCFESSQENFVRSVNTLYRGGIASKQKYNAVRSSLTMCSTESGSGTKHINFMKNIPVPKLFTYKNLLTRINEIDIGELIDVRETLCNGLEEEDKVDGKFRDLLHLLISMARFLQLTNGEKTN